MIKKYWVSFPAVNNIINTNIIHKLDSVLVHVFNLWINWTATVGYISVFTFLFWRGVLFYHLGKRLSIKNTKAIFGQIY